MVVHVPHDVWIHIANFLPDTVLQHLFAVNSALHHIALDIRYREVTVTGLVGARIANLLRRLKDPYVANRVRSLNLYFVKDDEYFLNWERHRPKTDRWRRLTDWVVRKPGGPRSAVDEVILILVNLVQGLPNVIVFNIYAHDQQLSESSGPVFAAAWKTFGANLRKLSLEGVIYHLQEPLSFTDCPQLQELQLKIRDVKSVNAAPAANDTLCNVIAPAVNKFSPVLTTLWVSFTLSSVTGDNHLDLSDFLKRIDPLPKLSALTLQVPLPTLADPSGLKLILQTHATTLRHVNFKLDGFYGTRSLVTEGLLLNLRTELLADESSFVGLRSFEFNPTIPCSFDFMAAFLTRSADTLTSLTVFDHYLTYEEVTTFASVFYRKTSLRSLVLDVRLLGPHLMTLLATNFSGLKRLKLRSFTWGIEGTSLVNPNLSQGMDAFRAEMMKEKAVFASWNLQDVTITLVPSHHALRWPFVMSKYAIRELAEYQPIAQITSRIEQMLLPGFWGEQARRV